MSVVAMRQNAIQEQIVGGDIQACPLYGVGLRGSIEVNGTMMENDSAGFGTQIGFDVYCEGQQDRSLSAAFAPKVINSRIQVFLENMETQTGLSLVYEALRRVNQIRPPDAQVPEDPDVVLLGDKGLLDSMAVTVLIVTLENLLREKTGQEVSLLQDADFEVLTEQFRTPRVIAELIAGSTS